MFSQDIDLGFLSLCCLWIVSMGDSTHKITWKSGLFPPPQWSLTYDMVSSFASLCVFCVCLWSACVCFFPLFLWFFFFLSLLLSLPLPLLLSLLCFLLWFLCFVFTCFLSKEREILHGVGRVGKWGGSGRRWWREDCDQNILYE